tara:strand:+ start:3536 stop:3922 length:387 start_codon:yes stop_codon:yes gene_type:complete
MENLLKTYGDRLTVETSIQQLNDIKERFRGTGINPENISIILLSLMNEVNKFKKLTGSQKKTLVTVLLTHFVTELASEENQPALREMIRMTIPALIDSFVDISKGLELKNLKNRFTCSIGKFCYGNGA